MGRRPRRGGRLPFLCRQGLCWARDTELSEARPSLRDTGFRVTMAERSKCRALRQRDPSPSRPQGGFLEEGSEPTGRTAGWANPGRGHCKQGPQNVGCKIGPVTLRGGVALGAGAHQGSQGGAGIGQVKALHFLCWLRLAGRGWGRWAMRQPGGVERWRGSRQAARRSGWRGDRQ